MKLPGSDRTRAIVGAILVMVLLALRLLAPEPLDWTPTYRVDSTQPYGTRMIRELAPDLFPGRKVVTSSMAPYLVLREPRPDLLSYVVIDEVYDPNPAEIVRLLDFAARGNTVFIAAADLGKKLEDTLNVHLRPADIGSMIQFPLEEDSTRTITFVHPQLRARRFSFPASAIGTFTRIDTMRTAVLAQVDSWPVLIRSRWSKGQFILCSIPRAFTNYYQVHPEAGSFGRLSLSYLPVRDVLWDAYHTGGQAGTPLRYILATRPLRLAFFVIMTGLLLLVINSARRRQRAVPVVTPPRNDSIDFARTVARFFMHRGGRKHVADRRIHNFYAWLRMEFGLDPGRPEQQADRHFLEALASRSGVPLEHLSVLFHRIYQVTGDTLVTASELYDLSHDIDEFYRLSNRSIA